MRALLVIGVMWLAACEPVSCGGGRGVVLDRDPEEVTRCRARQRPQVTPLFSEGAAETSPAVVVRADGAIITTLSGRVRGRHERETRFASYDTRSFENRSYALVIEDSVPLGRAEVKVTFFPAADVSTFGPGTNFRHWKVYGPAGNNGGGYTFAVNIGMTQVGPRELVQTVTQNARENRPIVSGDILDFELGIYLAGADPLDPQPIAGGSAYFSDTYRYRIGVGGLTPENFDDAGVLGPPLRARLGGETTVPWVALNDGTPVAAEYGFSQLALNAQPPHAQQFLEGRRVFFTDLETGAHAENGNPPLVFPTPPLGPLFNARSCVSCHEGNGRGVLPGESLVLQLEGSDGFGAQLQLQEAAVTLERIETIETVNLAEGTNVTLTRPVFDAGLPLRSSARLAPALVGLGLLESIDDEVLLELADENDCDSDGISGRVAVVEGRVGRFGWRASRAGLDEQLVLELAEQHGVTANELSDEQRARLTTYVRLLGVLPQRGSDVVEVQQGEALFGTAGCASCHVGSLQTGARHPFVELRNQTIRPFSDLLLHDLGPGLADGTATQEWRTAPLWGLGSTREISGAMFLLHDGRARTVLEAILWHGGEAQRARDAVVAMTSSERQALVRFVESL